MIHSFSERPELRSMRTYESYESAPCRRSDMLQQTTRLLMKSKNPDCIITIMQWSCRTWRRNGFNVIHATQISSGNAEKSSVVLSSEENPRSIVRDNSMESLTACEELHKIESMRHRRSFQKSFILTIRWNLAEPVKMYCGIIVLQRHILPKHMEVQNELYDE